MGGIKKLKRYGPRRCAVHRERAPQIEKYLETRNLAHKIILAGGAYKQEVHCADGRS